MFSGPWFKWSEWFANVRISTLTWYLVDDICPLSHVQFRFDSGQSPSECFWAVIDCSDLVVLADSSYLLWHTWEVRDADSLSNCFSFSGCSFLWCQCLLDEVWGVSILLDSLLYIIHLILESILLCRFISPERRDSWWYLSSLQYHIDCMR